MKQRSYKRCFATILAATLSLSSILSLSGCSGSSENVEARDLLANLKSSNIQSQSDVELQSDTQPQSDIQSPSDVSRSGEDAVMDFSVRLFQEKMEAGTNTLLSPLSVMYALSMTANGAANETLSQMEAVLGLPVQELNEYLSAYQNSLISEPKSRLQLADAIWFRDSKDFQVRQEFLQAVADHYDASIFQAPFDEQTLKDINAWVNEKTEEKIPRILSEIDGDAVMYLINALSFDAEWADPYTEYNCYEDVFTCEDGTDTDAVFMRSQEHQYLEDEHAAGFLKYYYNQNYAFAALLPKEGMTVEEYVSTLTGETLKNLLEQKQDVPVNAALPKFETESSTELSDVLQKLGMTDLFSMTDADLSGVGTSSNGPIYASKVIHKTFLALDEQGTKAAAASAVALASGAAMPDPQEPKEVILNRPFLYLVIDCSEELPLFIGVANRV